MRKRTLQKNILLAGTLCVIGTAGLALSLTGRTASAQQQPCDFLTGGGFIITAASGTPSKANFAIAGGCKHGMPTWGHLQYQDKGNGLKVKGTSITAYLPEGATVADPQTGNPIGTRIICGTASTNLHGNVDFRVRARDGGPGSLDEFDILLKQGAVPVYATEPENQLEGGNIELHKPNPSTSGSFGGSCPAPEPGEENFTLEVTKEGTAAGSGTVTSSPPGISCAPSDTTCSASFMEGTTVTLTAQGPADQAIDITWSGDCEATTPVAPGPPSTSTCTLTMDANKMVTVNFSFIE